jgi:hypothetical protein
LLPFGVAPLVEGQWQFKRFLVQDQDVCAASDRLRPIETLSGKEQIAALTGSNTMLGAFGGSK